MIAVILLRGTRMLRLMTLVPVVLGMAFLIRMGAPVMDLHLSSRPLALEITSLQPAPAPIAVYGVKRDVDYGLNFYRNQQIFNYEIEVPGTPHLLVVPKGKLQDAQKLAGNWSAVPIGEYKPQKLEFYWMNRVPPEAKTP
jgi:hypothetical protein